MKWYWMILILLLMKYCVMCNDMIIVMILLVMK